MTLDFPKWMGEYPRSNTPWYNDEVVQLMDHLKQGKTINQIIKIHGRTEESIICKLRDRCKQFDSFYMERQVTFDKVNNKDNILYNSDLSWIFNVFDKNGNRIKIHTVVPKGFVWNDAYVCSKIHDDYYTLNSKIPNAISKWDIAFGVGVALLGTIVSLLILYLTGVLPCF